MRAWASPSLTLGLSFPTGETQLKGVGAVSLNSCDLRDSAIPI